MTLPDLNFDLRQKNGAGNTALHLAIKTSQLKFVRMILVKLSFLSSSENTTENEDMDPKYFNMKNVRELSVIANNKGVTPLIAAVE